FTLGGKFRLQYVDELAAEVRAAIHYVGDASMFLFGSDYPVESVDAALDFARKLMLDDSDFELLVEQNAKRVFGL
ncbi:MAG: hypothetical protein QW767_06545, partial [Thermoprotei archaeon]